jgi:hypothetical protein
MLGGFTDKIAEIQEKVTEVVEKVPVPGKDCHYYLIRSRKFLKLKKIVTALQR